MRKLIAELQKGKDLKHLFDIGDPDPTKEFNDFIKATVMDYLEAILNRTQGGFYILDMEDGTFGVYIAINNNWDENDPYFKFDLAEMTEIATEDSDSISVRKYRNKLQECLTIVDDYIKLLEEHGR